MITLRWTDRGAPLDPAGAVAQGPAAARLRDAAAAAPTRLRAVGDAAWLVVLGELSDLPWADGVTYLGWDGGLLLPTLLAPSFPSDLLRRALHPEPDELIVVLPQTVLRAPIPVGPADFTGASGR